VSLSWVLRGTAWDSNTPVGPPHVLGPGTTALTTAMNIPDPILCLEHPRSHAAQLRCDSLISIHVA